jgi:hypothetical protein
LMTLLQLHSLYGYLMTLFQLHSLYVYLKTLLQLHSLYDMQLICNVMITEQRVKTWRSWPVLRF